MKLKKCAATLLFLTMMIGVTGGSVLGYFQNKSGSSSEIVSEATVRVKAIGPVTPGREATLAFELESPGKVNVVSFTVNFNPSVFTYVSSSLGADKPATTNLAVNVEQTAKGKFGLLVDSSHPFDKGKKQVVTAVFRVAQNAAPGKYDFSFSATPTQQGLATIEMKMLKADYETGVITVSAPRKAIVGQVLDKINVGVGRAKVTLMSPDGSEKTYVTGTFGNFIFDDLSDGIYTVTVSGKSYSFPPQSTGLNGTFTELKFVEAR